jgi:signal transduction histidine kinase
MITLRQRLFLSVAALLALQVSGTFLGFISWWRVQEAAMMQVQLGDQRKELLALARAARELYVHQTHTFIEGGPRHLDHLGEAQSRVDLALHHADSMQTPFSVDIGPVRKAVSEANWWFASEVAPRAQDGSLNRELALELHQVAEVQAGAVQEAIDGVLTQLAIAESDEVNRISTETRHAWVAVGVVVAVGLLLGALVAGGLARNILEAERRKVERERLQALGEIAGAVAHELLNPIGAILAESRADPIDARRIQQEADHARKVVQGLLGYARPGEAEPTTVRLDEATAAAVERAVLFADARGVGLSWKGGEPTSLLAAPTAVRQVLDNLIRNAIEASAEGDEVEVEVLKGTIEIRDRGPGIPASLRQRLYEPFVTGRPDGTGLGLAVSQRIARSLGGEIRHQTRMGGGTIARWEVQHG